MRLGDLDALRKNMEFICMGIMAGTAPYNAPLTEIDNAPTVKFSLMPADETKEDAYKRGYKKGKVDGLLKANARPIKLVAREV